MSLGVWLQAGVEKVKMQQSSNSRRLRRTALEDCCQSAVKVLTFRKMQGEGGLAASKLRTWRCCCIEKQMQTCCSCAAPELFGMLIAPQGVGGCHPRHLLLAAFECGSKQVGLGLR
jgi:hypothetical protein